MQFCGGVRRRVHRMEGLARDASGKYVYGTTEMVGASAGAPFYKIDANGYTETVLSQLSGEPRWPIFPRPE